MMKLWISVFAIGCSFDANDKNHCETLGDCLNGYTCSPDNTCVKSTGATGGRA